MDGTFDLLFFFLHFTHALIYHEVTADLIVSNLN